LWWVFLFFLLPHFFTPSLSLFSPHSHPPHPFCPPRRPFAVPSFYSFVPKNPVNPMAAPAILLPPTPHASFIRSIFSLRSGDPNLKTSFPPCPPILSPPFSFVTPPLQRKPVPQLMWAPPPPSPPANSLPLRPTQSLVPSVFQASPHVATLPLPPFYRSPFGPASVASCFSPPPFFVTFSWSPSTSLVGGSFCPPTQLLSLFVFWCGPPAKCASLRSPLYGRFFTTFTFRGPFFITPSFVF